jgi:hypothetical protein
MQVFQHLPSENQKNPSKSKKIPYQLEPTINRLKRTEVQAVINNIIHPKKSPGYNLITGKILKELTTIQIQYPLELFNVNPARRVLPSIMKSRPNNPCPEISQTSRVRFLSAN